jgi:hypothetical protein
LPLLVSPEWVEERKVRWGVTSPIYQSKVLGEFPDISDDTLILPKWIEAAQKRTLERTRRPIIAADIARFGEDETVIMRREGGWIRVYRAHHKADTMVTAGHIAKAMRDIDDEAGKNDWVRAIIDVPGVGGGVVDRLAELELPVVPYNGGEAPIDKERFVNARAEDYWTLRERFEQGEIDIDPDDDKLAAQLGSIKWGIDSRGRIKIESKDDMRKRGLPSPDRADAMAIAFAGRANAAPINVESHAGESIAGDLMTKVCERFSAQSRRVILRPFQGHPNQPTLDSSPSAVEAVMPTITLIERPAAGDETELRASSSHWSPGDQLFIVERVLEDQNGNAAGSFVFRGTVVKVIS